MIDGVIELNPAKTGPWVLELNKLYDLLRHYAGGGEKSI